MCSLLQSGCPAGRQRRGRKSSNSIRFVLTADIILEKKIKNLRDYLEILELIFSKVVLYCWGAGFSLQVNFFFVPLLDWMDSLDFWSIQLLPVYTQSDTCPHISSWCWCFWFALVCATAAMYRTAQVGLWVFACDTFRQQVKKWWNPTTNLPFSPSWQDGPKVWWGFPGFSFSAVR